MKNRGFTLLELLGVIVILALLTTLVFPSVLNAIKKSSEETDKLSMDLISNAADLYIESHANDFKKRNGSKYFIDMSELIEDGNLPSNLKISDIEDIQDKCVQITYNNKFNYELKDKGTCQYIITLSEEYQQVEYIENSGTQYIDTEYMPNNTTKVEIIFKLTELGVSSSQYILGSRETSNSDIVFALGGAKSNEYFYIYLLGNQKTISTTRQKDNKYKQILEIEYSSNSGYRLKGIFNDLENNSEQSIVSAYNSLGLIEEYPNLYLFAFNSNNIHGGLIVYNLKIWDNSVLVRDLIPCYRKSDNEIGMYDLVNDVFYTNSGTGTFEKGPNI